jgi:two-component system response regulator LytT
MGDKKVLRIVLVEDEQPASRQLKRLLAEVLPNSEVVQVLDSVEEAVSYFKNEEDVDLIFLDIHLADGLSFDIFDQVNLPAPVIFTTAYDQYAIKAFKVHSIDYLLKPIEKDDLKGAIDKFFELRLESTSGNVDYGKLIQAMREAGNPFKKRFLVKPGGRLAFVNTEDVSYFFSEEGFTFLVVKDGERFVIESTLEEIEAQLNPNEFFRINRQMIISLQSIDRIDPHFNHRYNIALKPVFGSEVLVSRQRATDFKKWLDQ